MYKKGMRRAAALLAVCWLGLLFRAAAETPAEKLERLRAEQQAIEQQIEQNRTDAARAGDLVNLYTAKEQNVKAQIADSGLPTRHKVLVCLISNGIEARNDKRSDK